MKAAAKSLGLLFIVCSMLACQSNFSISAQRKAPVNSAATASEKPPIAAVNSAEIRRMLENAERQIGVTKSYDPRYVVIGYPNGDVTPETGVCTDVVIRAFRAAGVDLQKEVHEDMSKNFAVYPKKWGLKSTDTNIDHRRVPNLQTFFARRGKNVPVTNDPSDYKPGDIVTWDLNGKGLTHIGVVSNLWNEQTKRYLVFHNIGRGAQAEDVLFDWKITGHYRYF